LSLSTRTTFAVLTAQTPQSSDALRRFLSSYRRIGENNYV